MSRTSLFAGFAGTLLLSTALQAADHLDAPALFDDPAADINDVYAFVNPNDPDEVIFAATVLPLATERSRFSDKVVYRFSLQSAAPGAAVETIDCRFPGNAVVCKGPGNLEVAGPRDRVNTQDGMRLFAGLRDDPFFFDLAAFQETVATLEPQFRDPGTDFFDGLGTLAIVLGVDRSLLQGDSPVYRVYAATRRADSPGETRPSLQVDRMGRPAVNTALIDLLTSTGLKDQYNQSEDIAAWPGLFQAEIADNLAALDTLDGVPGNALLPPLVLASVLVDDRLVIDTAQPLCDAYLAVELGVPQCGGRTLSRDVIDDTLGAVVGPGVSDFVPDTNAFLPVFPFLGAPD